MPALTPVVDSLDKVPEPARGFYEQKDGKYALILDAAPAGFVPAADLAAANGKVVEFRDANIALLKEVEPLRKVKADLGDADPVAAREAIAKLGDLGKKGIKAADDVATLVQTSLDAALKPIREELTASKAETTAERARADAGVLRQTVSEKFLKAGGKAKAIDYIVDKAKTAFGVEGGAVKALANKFSIDRPSEPLGIDEWIVQAAKEHDFAFEPSTGAGADPKKNGGATLRAGQTVLRDPTAKQLGEAASDIKAGKVKVEYSK